MTIDQFRIVTEEDNNQGVDAVAPITYTGFEPGVILRAYRNDDKGKVNSETFISFSVPEAKELRDRLDQMIQKLDKAIEDGTAIIDEPARTDTSVS